MIGRFTKSIPLSSEAFTSLLRKAVLSGAIAALLAACTAPAAPQLGVSDKSLELSSASRRDTLTISNKGKPGTMLAWSITSKSERITVTPSKGVLKGNDEDTVVIEVNQKGLSKGDSIHDTLLLNSDYGPKGVNVNFSMTVEGLGACGVPIEEETAAPGVTQKPVSRAPNRPKTPYVPGELLVRYREPATLGVEQGAMLDALQRTSKAVASDFGLQPLYLGGLYAPDLVWVSADEGGALKINTLDVEALDMEALARRLEADPRVLYAEPNYYLEPLETRPNDEDLADQWSLLDFGLPQAWDIDTGENSVVIAVIDSGVDTRHEDLSAKMLPGCDFYDGDNDPNPGAGSSASEHGTHVAGIAAAVGNNGLGVAGVAYGPGVKILPIKVFDDTGYVATTAELIHAVLWAAGLPVAGVAPNPNKADIINMSLGTGKKEIQSIDEAMQEAAAAGVVLFAAAGNAGDSSGAASGNGIMSPANAPGVIAVGAVNGDYRRAEFSDYAALGRTVDVMAPGGRAVLAESAGGGAGEAVLSTLPDNRYSALEGTSMASPFAAGVAALVLSQNPNLSPQQVKAKLVKSARFDAEFMTKSEYGAGVLCADKALGAPTRCGR